MRPRVEHLEPRRLPSYLIAEIDSGVDLNSAQDAPYYDLADGINAYTMQPALPDRSNIADNAGHGTAVANEIVHGIQEVTSQPGTSGADVKILPIRVTSNSGQYDAETYNAVLRGVFYAAYHHVAVINLSLVFLERGDSPGYVPVNPDPSYTNAFPTLGNAIAYANSMGTVVVTGAGNNHYDLDGGNPATNGYLPNHIFPSELSAPNLIVAASVDANDNLTSVSNYGRTHVTLGTQAPFDATSYAAARVSGVAGALTALNPNIRGSALVSVIDSTAQRVAQLAGLVSTGGVIDPAAAVKAVLPRAVPLTATSLGQDGHDLANINDVFRPAPGPDGLIDTHIALAGLPAGATIARVRVVRIGGGASYESNGGPWSWSSVVQRTGATTADVYFQGNPRVRDDAQPYAFDIFYVGAANPVTVYARVTR